MRKTASSPTLTVAFMAGFCSAFAAGAAGQTQSAPATQSGSVPAGPNLILILTDDQRWDTLGCTGHPFIRTPTIDRLARDGVRFENAFVITPVCAPSRATILTGRSTFAHGVLNNDGVLPRREKTIATYLKQAGYQTAFLGKYHLGRNSQPKPGWDHWVEYTAPQEGGRGSTYRNAVFTVDGQAVPRPGFSTDVLAEYAVDWIGRPRDAPFFLLLALRNAHARWLPPERHRALYTDAPLRLPTSYRDPVERLPRFIRGEQTAPPIIPADWMETFYEGAREKYTDDTLPRLLLDYARMIPSIDETVAKICDALRARGLGNNTVILYTSDNGLLAGEHGILGKGLPYEPSIRVPLILYDPRAHDGGRRLKQQVLNLDLAPTVLELAGLTPPPEMTGRSLLPLLADPQIACRQDWLIYSHVPPDARQRPDYIGLRSEQWKYVRYLRGGLEEELFDLRGDPDERCNLAGSPQHVARLEQFRARMRELMQADNLAAAWFEPFED